MPFLNRFIKKNKEEKWEVEEIDPINEEENGDREDDPEEDDEKDAKEDVEEETEKEEDDASNKDKETPPSLSLDKKKKSWMKKEGELVIDVYETEENIVIQAPIAGVKKEDLEIVTEKDMIVIKGKRERPEGKEIKGFYTNECFFGNFRREIILPEETDPSRIEASMEEGILSVSVPKIEREKKRKVTL